MADITMPQLGETVTEGTITKWFKQVGDQVERGRGPLRGVDRQGRLRGAVAGRRLPDRDPGAGGRDGRRRRRARRDRRPAAGGGDGAGAPTPAAEPSSAGRRARGRPPTAAGDDREAEAAGDAEPTPPARSPSRRRSRGPTPTAPRPAEAGAGARARSGRRAPAPAGRRRRRPAGDEPAAVAGRAPADRRARPRPRPDPGHRRRRPHHPRRRAGPSSRAATAAGAGARPRRASGRTGRSARAGQPRRRRRPRPAAAPAPPAGRPASGDEVVPVHQHPPAHRRAHGAVEGDLGPHAHRHRGRLRQRRPGAPARPKDAFKAEEGFSLTYLPFIARAVVDAIREFPHVNASVGDDELIVHHYVNLGIAVDLDFEGLIVPVVHDADGKRLRALAREIADLAARARQAARRRRHPGGTFTITNAGPYGTLITGAGHQPAPGRHPSTDGVKKRPVVVELPDGTDAIAIHPVGHPRPDLGPPGLRRRLRRRRSWPG